MQNLSVLLLGLPWALAPKSYTTAHRCKQWLVGVFHDYFNEGSAQNACSFIYELCQLSFRRGLSNEKAARAFLGSILAIVGNNIPTTFWILAHINSKLLLLTEIHRELELTLPCRSKYLGLRGRYISAWALFEQQVTAEEWAFKAYSSFQALWRRDHTVPGEALCISGSDLFSRLCSIGNEDGSDRRRLQTSKERQIEDATYIAQTCH